MAYIESGIYVEGLNQMIAGLRAMSSEATKEVQALNLKVGNMVKTEAKILAPVGKTNGGALRDSIRTSKALFGAFVYAGRDPLIPYANVQNWGWFYDKKNFIYKNIMPQQFMNKAAAKVRDEVAVFYVDELLKIYDKYSKGTGNINSDNKVETIQTPTVGRRYR